MEGNYKVLKTEIKKHIMTHLDIADKETHEVVSALKKLVFDKSQDMDISLKDKRKLINDIINMTKGLGIIEDLVSDDSVTEIMVNGTDRIFVERKGKITEEDLQFESKKDLLTIVQRIASKVNRQVNQNSPIVDARWNGMRVNAVIEPISLKGPILTIRKFPANPLTMENLISYNSINEEAAEFLRKLVVSKYNIFISGGTGSGKTTFLNILSNYIPNDERVITIEDSAELQLRNIDNLVSLETRTSGDNPIEMADLIKSSLRMRPDRIVVGEVRSKEALDMLQAMNTGHDGSLSTGHANSAIDMLSRIETMVLSGVELPLDAIRQQINSAIDIIVHLGRLRDRSRRVLQIAEVTGFENGRIQMSDLYRFKEFGEDEDKKIIGELVRTENKLKYDLKVQMAGISLE